MGRNAQRGFTLIELMVGLLLSMLTVLVITQVLTLAEGKSRTISGGSEAQVNASLALFTLQRDIQQAGYGATSNPEALGCPVRSGIAGLNFSLAPVVIADGGNGTQTITILQGNTANSSAPMPLTATVKTTPPQFPVYSSLGVRAGDLVVAVPPLNYWDGNPAPELWCTLFSVAATPANPLMLTSVPFDLQNTWNQNLPLPTSAQYTGDGSATSSYLLNLGAMVLRVYSVSAEDNLQMNELLSTGAWSGAQDLYPQIVSLQARYGKDMNGDGIIDTYDLATPTTNAGWKQVLAVRIAVVGRSTQYEKDEVTLAAPTWQIGNQTFTLSVAHVPDWQHYRYKIYDTIVPLRNMLWNDGSAAASAPAAP
ncbi:MAG: PilW family protein [Betaproteobacteria bacterium]|nr:PilW family protein [Betaproteobacteria bacterium]